MENQKGVMCPNVGCAEKFVWSWCIDVYVHVGSGAFCKLVEGPEQQTIFKCSCGRVLGHQTADGTVVNNDFWSDIDWDLHSYE